MTGHSPSGFSARNRIHSSINYSPPGPEAAKQAQTVTLPPQCLTVGVVFLL